MRYYIYANTIADTLAKSNKNMLKLVSSAMGKDIIYVQQKFIGRGFSKILSFDESELKEAENIRRELEKLNVGTILIDKFKTKEIAGNAFKTAVIEEYSDRFRFLDSKGRDVYIDKENEILVVGGIDMKSSTADTLKKLCLTDTVLIYIYAGKEKRIIELDNATVNYMKIKEPSKYSKTENLNKVLMEFKNRSKKFKEDYIYSVNYTPEISPSLLVYTAIASFMFEGGMYDAKYSEDFFNPDYKESDKSLYYDFKFDIYHPGELSRKTRPVKNLNLMQTAMLPLIPAVFIGAVFFRTQASVLLMVFSFIASAYYGFHFFRIFKMKLFFESVSFSKVKSMSVGLNEVRGAVIDRNAIPSPISGIKAVYFRYSKYRKEKVKEGKEDWKLVEVGEYVPASFYLDCNGDIMEVKTQNASINLHSSNTYHGTHFQFFCMDDSDKVKFVEEVLPVSAEVFVIGSAVYSDRGKELDSFIKNKKADREFMEKFDEDKDKFIDESEWSKAKQTMELEFDDRETKKKEHELLSMQYTKDDNILFVSDMSKASMLKRFDMFLAASGILGIAGLIIGIILIWR
ncbi:MAG: hypothetical protein AB7T10_08695 [bacterium]